METRTAGRLRELTAGELRATLARKRISAAELARRMGWAQSYMARRIDGRVALDIDDLEAIARILEVNIIDLLPNRGQAINDGLLRPTKRGMRSKLHARPRPGMTRISAPGTGVPATIRRPVPVAYRSDEAVA